MLPENRCVRGQSSSEGWYLLVSAAGSGWDPGEPALGLALSSQPVPKHPLLSGAGDGLLDQAGLSWEPCGFTSLFCDCAICVASALAGETGVQVTQFCVVYPVKSDIYPMEVSYREFRCHQRLKIKQLFPSENDIISTNNAYFVKCNFDAIFSAKIGSIPCISNPAYPKIWIKMPQESLKRLLIF